MHPKISLKTTTDNDLLFFHTTGFTMVYNASHGAGGTNPSFIAGQNDLLFYQSFAWNGTDNIIIEFTF